MVMREVSLCLLLGHLLIDPCAFCSIHTSACINDTSNMPLNCTLRDFQVSVNSNGSNFQEGDDITLTCVHNIPDLITMFRWKGNGKVIQECKNQSTLHLEEVHSDQAGPYICCVKSLCCDYCSQPYTVTVDNQSVLILVICGISALVLVLVMGLAMKFKLKRDNAKHKERRKQKAEAEQRNAPAPFPQRES